MTEDAGDLSCHLHETCLFTKRASSDLDAIFTYISNRLPGNAPGFIRQILDAIDSLERFPHRYPAVEQQPRVRAGTRAMPVSPYLVYYRVLEPQLAVRIITIRHGARREPRRFSGSMPFAPSSAAASVSAASVGSGSFRYTPGPKIRRKSRAPCSTRAIVIGFVSIRYAMMYEWILQKR